MTTRKDGEFAIISLLLKYRNTGAHEITEMLASSIFGAPRLDSHRRP